MGESLWEPFRLDLGPAIVAPHDGGLNPSAPLTAQREGLWIGLIRKPVRPWNTSDGIADDGGGDSGHTIAYVGISNPKEVKPPAGVGMEWG